MIDVTQTCLSIIHYALISAAIGFLLGIVAFYFLGISPFKVTLFSFWFGFFVKSIDLLIKSKTHN